MDNWGCIVFMNSTLSFQAVFKHNAYNAYNIFYFCTGFLPKHARLPAQTRPLLNWNTDKSWWRNLSIFPQSDVFYTPSTYSNTFSEQLICFYWNLEAKASLGRVGVFGQATSTLYLKNLLRLLTERKAVWAISQW